MEKETDEEKERKRRGSLLGLITDLQNLMHNQHPDIVNYLVFGLSAYNTFESKSYINSFSVAECKIC